jgi:hypothetical protein
MMTQTAPRQLDIAPIIGSRKTVAVEIQPELRLLEGDEQPAPGHFVFRILNPLTGDDRLTWDSTSLPEIKAAKQQFLDLVEKGLTPYRVGVNGKPTAEVMDEFDPTAEEVVFLGHQLVAGG